ncbi:complement C1q-like protein 4 [Mya arenaria]|uniref:complement C1q-like protein 4 n=1 Tax=Mya arenaria TaxID=6604 RepID=UPI0022E7A2FB|nr:complement C1q-like protein 4 [Mya arenaria]XP_052798674.1 complement C1q-like protein 4 [Mya arenaria]
MLFMKLLCFLACTIRVDSVRSVAGGRLDELEAAVGTLFGTVDSLLAERARDSNRISALERRVDELTHSCLENRTKRFLLDGEGQVAFMVGLQQSDDHLTPDDIVPFDSIVTNEGGGYNAGLHVFVCPLRGVYAFQSSLMADYHKHIETQLVKEGKVLAHMYAAGSTAGHGFDQGYNSAVTRCEAGEHVWVKLRGASGTTVVADGFSTFSGYLLWAL